MAYSQVQQRLVQEAARFGLSPDAYLRMLQGPGAGVSAPAVAAPQPRQWDYGPGPGGQPGGGSGQVVQPASWPGKATQTRPQDVGIGGQIDPSGAQSDGQPPSIWGQIKSALGIGAGPESGVVPFGQRMGNVGAILGALADPQGRSLAPTLVNVNDQLAQQRDVAARQGAYYADLKRQQAMAESLYNNLKGTNPQLAEMIRANPALVQDYMKGQIDLQNTTAHDKAVAEQQTALEKLRQGGAMDIEKYKIENDPNTVLAKQWQTQWGQFANENKNLSTKDLYDKWYQGENFTASEAKRLADGNMQGGLKGLEDAYGKVIDDRSKGTEVTTAKEAAALAGISLKPGQYIKNRQEVIDSGGKVAPILEWAQGSDEAKAAEAEGKYNWKTDSADYLATQRAIDALDVQASDKSGLTTGAGWSGYAEYLPETNARELGRALQSVNAGEAFKKLADIRKANPTGAGVGNVTEGEYPILTAAEGEKFDILQGPDVLKKRLVQHQNIATAFMSASPHDQSVSALQDLVNRLRKDPTPEHMQEFDDKFGSGYARLVLTTQGGTLPK